MEQLHYHTALVVGLCLFGLLIFRRRAKPTLINNTDENGPVTDLIRMSWDLREQIRSATTRAELEACAIELEFMEGTFQGLIPEPALSETINRLQDYLDLRRESKNVN